MAANLYGHFVDSLRKYLRSQLEQAFKLAVVRGADGRQTEDPYHTGRAHGFRATLEWIENFTKR